MEALPSPLSSRAKPRDLRCATRWSRIPHYKPQPPNKCVIPTEAKRSGGTCCSSSALSNLNGSATLPFVIPSEAEGSAVRHSVVPNPPSQTTTSKQMCHPNRSEAQWRDQNCCDISNEITTPPSSSFFQTRWTPRRAHISVVPGTKIISLEASSAAAPGHPCTLWQHTTAQYERTASTNQVTR